MNAASLQKTAGVPAAGASSASAPQGAASGGVKPMANQGFVPVSGAPAQGAPAGSAQGPSPDGSLPADQALAALVQVLGGDKGEYGEPIIAVDGTVYMEKRKPNVVNGSLSLAYVVVGKIDKTTGRMKISPAILEQIKAKSGGAAEKKLVKVDDQYVWQTFSKSEDGKVIAEVTPATQEELAAYQAKAQAQQAQEAAQAKLQDRGDWQQKIGIVAQHLGIFGVAGQLVSGLAAGPNALTGHPGAGWIQGWMLAQRLNGKAEGKLLPQFMQSGPVATALEWGMQAYGMLDMGRDIGVVRDFLQHKPPLPPVNPKAVEQLIAAGEHPAMAGAMAGLGKELRDGTLSMVEGTENAAVINTKLGALQLVPKDSLYKSFAATDPVQSTGVALRGKIDSGVVNGLGLLKGLVQPAMIGASALGLVSSVIGVKNLLATKGKAALVDTQQGRGAVLGAVSSVSYLGMYLVPMAMQALKVAVPAVAAASSAINIAANVLGGIQMLNSYGLFGGEQEKNGFLDNDAFRAAFLIPPLTPIGGFAFWLKSRRKKQAAEAAQLEAAKKLAVDRVAQQREMAKLQLQAGGAVSGSTAGVDGTINVATGIPQDLSRLAAQLSGGSAAAAPVAASPAAAAAPATSGGSAGDAAGSSALQQQRAQLAMTAKPMR